MKEILEIAGFSRQAHSQYMERRGVDEEIAQIVISSVIEARGMHPVMGLKKIYYLFKPDYIGRDRFIEIGVINGMAIQRLRSYQRTTFSNRYAQYKNLTVDLSILDINQVFVSDITYFRVGDVFYYLTFLMDVFSRRILGYVAYPTLEAKANCIALNMALDERQGMNLDKLIHHSDRGVQYTSNAYLNILKARKIRVSMCESVFENSHIERVNGIIKNEYLTNWKIQDFRTLKKCLKEAVNSYNNERPHWSIGTVPPVKYELELKKIALSERKPLVMFSNDGRKINNNYYDQFSLFN